MKLLSQTAVAKRLDVGDRRVRQLDHLLKPIKVEGGHRVYLEHLVDRVAAKRDTYPRSKKATP